MTADELIDYFGGSLSKTARALGVAVPSVHLWKVTNVVPILRQYQVELGTHGALKADVPPLHASTPEQREELAA